MAEEKNLPMIQVNAQYIKDLSFEAPEMPFIVKGMTQMPQIDLKINVKADPVPEVQTDYTVELSMKATATIGEKTAFICEITYGALVSLNVPEEHVQPLLLIEVPHLLFPYVRSVLSNVTREAGFPPIAVNPIDFAALFRQQAANIQSKEVAEEKPAEEKKPAKKK